MFGFVAGLSNFDGRLNMGFGFGTFGVFLFTEDFPCIDGDVVVGGRGRDRCRGTFLFFSSAISCSTADIAAAT
tara:strand:- start:12 stop:230 length:219 start_codon:yes stop_codon:yes gene_type:complete